MSEQYDKYLKEHIGAVKKAARWMLDNLAIADELSDDEVETILYNVDQHDTSKYSVLEYKPYDDYFYGKRDEDMFNLAWLHHIHRNQHHWQHWLLVNDDGKNRDADKLIALEMPKVHAFEMVADWWSFSWRSGNLDEIFDWYRDHENCIILHPNTREYVVSILNEIADLI